MNTAPHTPVPHHPIAVVGAGLGGLTLARVLHVHGVPCALFDLDASAGARHQGGMLDLHEETAQAALRAAGLYEEFRALVLPGGEESRLIDPDGTLRRLDTDDGDGGRPEVNRADLRRLLLDSLPAGTIRWGAKVTATEPAEPPGRHLVTLADGSRFTTDLLIGADGAWSRVRPLLTDARPAYTGISFVESDVLPGAERFEELAAFIGGGSSFTLGDGKGLLTHREGDGRIHTYVAVRAPEEWLGTLDFSDTRAARAAVLALFDGWDERLRALIADGAGPLTPRLIHALPVGTRWERVPGATLLGDAAHLMSPFAGEGANLAMFDGAELARTIVTHPGDREAALTAYEEELFPRSEATAADSAGNLALMFGPDAQQKLCDMFAGFDAAATAAQN
ncbi:NAD(P)/FAD-dependent oxidoreductase [Streptomyces sp. NPDC006552]|uniref:FAD-dependent oxidoreductase n=1 Tax=Streptomyces sp. NPDC006552 TaxID=3157179 RepID=UPI00339DE7F6